MLLFARCAQRSMAFWSMRPASDRRGEFIGKSTCETPPDAAAASESWPINADMVRIARSPSMRPGTWRQTLYGAKHLGDAAQKPLPDCRRLGRSPRGRVVQIVDQPAKRLGGEVPDGATRLVSLHDSDAFPIRKGRLGKSVESATRLQVVDNEAGVVLDDNIEGRQPSGYANARLAIERLAGRTRRMPKAITADRGYEENTVGDSGARSEYVPSSSRQRQTEPATARRRERRAVPPPGEVENRKRRPDQRTLVDAGHRSTGSKEPAPGAVTGSSTTSW